MNSKELTAYLTSGAEGENPFLKAKAETGANAAKLQQYLKVLQSKELQDQVNQGGSVKVGDIAVGADPTARRALNDEKGEEAARQKAIANYNHALPKLQQTFQAAQEGLAAVNDPRNPGSMGQARTLALKAMGMSRYNEKEAEAVVPPALRGSIAALFNKAGDDMNPLNESQRAALNQFFQTQAHTVKQQHDQLKQSSMDTYDMSRYAAPMGHDTIKNRMGGGFSQALDESEKKYQNVPATQGPNLTQAPNPGPLDRLKSFFGVKHQAATPQAAQAPQQAQPAPDPIADELAKRAQQSLSQPKAPMGQ